jgi:hypothetical protein
MLRLKQLVSTAFLVLFIWSAGGAQDVTRSVSDRYFPPMSVTASGGVMTFTYGGALTFPALWINESVKIEPMIGLVWRGFPGDSFSVYPAGGLRMLYYFKNQSLGGQPVNSAYLGLGGMSNDLMFGGRQYSNTAISGLIVGYSFALSSTIQLSPEVMAAIDEDSQFRPAVGVSLVVRLFQ